MNIGEIYETDILDFDKVGLKYVHYVLPCCFVYVCFCCCVKAIENLEQAADFYRGEDSNA